MKISFVNTALDEDWGGGENWTLAAAEGLSERGHQVQIIGRVNSRMVERAAMLDLEGVSVPVGIDYHPATIGHLLRHWRRRKPDVVFVHHNKDVRTAGPVASLLHIPVIHRNGFPILHDNIRHRLTNMMTTRILTNSRRIKELYSTYPWIDPETIDVVPNGKRLPERPTEPVNLRLLVSADDDTLLAVFAGRLTDVKRAGDLIRAIATLDKATHWRLVIIGQGEEEENLKQMVSEQKLEKTVHFLGFREDAWQLLGQADLAVLPSSEEGMPNTLMEAMLQGVPAAGTPVGDVPFLLDDGNAGWLVEVGDLAGWVSLFQQLENEPVLLHQLGEAARQRMKKHFTFDAMIDGVEASIARAVPSFPRR